MFFELYWPYFVAGLFIYIFARISYAVFKGVDEKKKIGLQKKNEESSQIQDVVNNESDSSEDELDIDDIVPALPENLEHVPLNFSKISHEQSLKNSQDFYDTMNMRRTVRHFSTEDVPIEVIRNVIKAAGTAPSGAHTEPWTFVVVHSKEIKEKIRQIIEDEEEINYKKRMGKIWTTDLKPLRTNWIKEYLTDAPYLILVFKQTYSFREDGKKKLHYYNEQSVSLAAGLLLAAIHYAGLVSLTSTPLNCGPALRSLLNRPKNEKLALLLPVGYPSKDCKVPDLKRKNLTEICVEI